MTTTMRRTIGAAAARCGLSRATLRKLETRGLVRPRRDWSGRRIYSDEDVQLLRQLAGLGPEAPPDDAGARLVLGRHPRPMEGE